MSRRELLILSSTSLLALSGKDPSSKGRQFVFTRRLRRLEKESGGRLGVFFYLEQTGSSFGYRDKERFALCSTFKLPLAAAILSEMDAGRASFETWVPYSDKDLVPHAPVTEKNLAKGGMTLGALAEAAQKESDNVAANLLLKRLGGPSGFTMWLKQIGDHDTRLDRYEPFLNVVPKGEVRDTTTPSAMAHTVATCLFGEVLQPTRVSQLRRWLEETKTGTRRLRSGLKADWPAGNKTGTGIAPRMANQYNDIAVVWPHGYAPVVITAYFEAAGHFRKIRAEDEAVLAEVGRIANEWIVQIGAEDSDQ